MTLIMEKMSPAEKAEWAAIRKSIRAFAMTQAGPYKSAINSTKIADGVIDAARMGFLIIPHGTDEDMLALFRSHVKAKIEKKIAGLKPAKTVEKPKKQRQHAVRKCPKHPDGRRTRPRGTLTEIVEHMDIKDVIANLPTIALLISRMNDLLKPIADPKPTKMSLSDVSPEPRTMIGGKPC